MPCGEWLRVGRWSLGWKKEEILLLIIAMTAETRQLALNEALEAITSAKFEGKETRKSLFLESPASFGGFFFRCSEW
jgi:hypothetical protein